MKDNALLIKRENGDVQEIDGPETGRFVHHCPAT